MRILFLTGSLATGGAERQVTLMARSMAELGHRVGIAVMYPGGELESELEGCDVQIFPLHKQGRWDISGFFSSLVRAACKFRPDILQTLLTTPNIAGVLLRPVLGNARVVWGIRNSNMDLSRYDTFSRYCSRIETFLSPSCDLAIANSEAGRKVHARRGIRSKRFEVIPNGIDTARFRPCHEERMRLRQLWQIPPEIRLCLTVGRLDPMKDHQTLLRSMQHWPENTMVAIVGPGTEQLKSEVERYGVSRHVRLPGPMNDIENAYAAADAFVLSSAFGEGFPNSIGEAMSSGLPIVATDVGDIRRIVGDCGLIVPPKDPARLGQAVGEIFSASRPDGDSRQRIISNYNLSIMIERTLQLYEQLLSKR